MTKVIGVRFRTAGKIYFFSPGKLEIKTGDKVIVETARGVEFGSVVTGPKEVEDDKITQPLKSVIRLATDPGEYLCILQALSRQISLINSFLYASDHIP